MDRRAFMQVVGAAFLLRPDLDTYHGPASVQNYQLNHFTQDRDLERAGRSLATVVYDLYDTMYDAHAIVETKPLPNDMGLLTRKRQMITHVLGDGVRVRTAVSSDLFDQTDITYEFAIEEGHGILEKQQWVRVFYKERTVEGACWNTKPGTDRRFEVYENSTEDISLLTEYRGTGFIQVEVFDPAQHKTLFETLTTLMKFQQAKYYQLSKKKN